MATEQDQRPRYYEDQYLGAGDLNDAVNFCRVHDAQHALGGHSWGISIGLELKEKPWPSGNRVDIYITPGYAWDGYGRPIVALAPAKITESLFSEVKYDSNNSDHRDGEGELVKVWLQYDERSLRTPIRGFESCSEGDHNARVQETFRIVIGNRGTAEQRGSVNIDGVPVDPRQAISQFDPLSLPPPGASLAPRTLYDESVPHQEFPAAESENPLPVWLVPIGYVRWLPVQNGLGHFIQRDDKGPDTQNPTKKPDSDMIREVRRYVGVVAESIEGAAGVIRLRNRLNDPSASHFTPPRMTTDPNAPPENDLVWVEGDLRVVGDTKLAGGKLTFRTAEGKDGGVPLEIRRTEGQAGGQGNRTLQVIIGPEGQDTNRLAVGRLKPDQSVDQKFVVTSAGNVGIGTALPSGKLDVANLVRVGLDEGGSGLKVITFARDAADEINAGKIAYKPTWDNGALAIVGAGNPPHRKVRLWEDVIVERTLGIGTVAPNGILDVANLVRVGLDEGGSGLKAITFARDAADEINAGKIAYKPTWDNGALAIVGAGNPPHRRIRMWEDVIVEGNVGIGAVSPTEKLDVRGNIKLGQGGDLFALGALENLRVVAGHVRSDGSMANGSGFTPAHIGSGNYRVSLTLPFQAPPVVVVSPVNSLDEDIVLTVRNLTGSSFGVFSRDVVPSGEGSPRDTEFTFIVIGRRT